MVKILIQIFWRPSLIQNQFESHGLSHDEKSCMDHIGQAGIHTTGVDAATGTQRSAHVPVMQVNPVTRISDVMEIAG